MKKYNVNGEEFWLEADQYADGKRLAIVMICDGREYYGMAHQKEPIPMFLDTLTVNLGDLFDGDLVALKVSDYPGCNGTFPGLSFLRENQYIEEEVVAAIPSGFCMYPVVRLTKKFKDRYVYKETI